MAIGHTPRSELVRDQVATDEQGYVLTQDGSTRTDLAGVFAVGDLVDHTYRQAVTAAGTGCMGALDAEWYLRDTPPSPEAHWAGKCRRGPGGRAGGQPDHAAPGRRLTFCFAGRRAIGALRALFELSDSRRTFDGSAFETRQ